MRDEEQRLIARARDGDQDAFGQLVTAHQQMVYALALRRLGDHHDAEEVAQTAFLKAWQGLAGFRGGSSFATWLYRLTVNACTDHLRRAGRDRAVVSLDDPDLPPPIDRAPTPAERAERRAEEDALHAALAALSEEHRTILLLRAVDGLRYDEIAARLGLTEGTVKSRLARARLRLREILAEDGNFFADLSSNETGTKKRKGGRRS